MRWNRMSGLWSPRAGYSREKPAPTALIGTRRGEKGPRKVKRYSGPRAPGGRSRPGSAGRPVGCRCDRQQFSTALRMALNSFYGIPAALVAEQAPHTPDARTGEQTEPGVADLPGRNSSIGSKSVAASHSASFTGAPSAAVHSASVSGRERPVHRIRRMAVRATHLAGSTSYDLRSPMTRPLGRGITGGRCRLRARLNCASPTCGTAGDFSCAHLALR